MFEKIKDFIMGKPKGHVVPAKLNRKQKRVALAMRQKRNAAASRHKHEKR